MTLTPPAPPMLPLSLGPPPEGPAKPQSREEAALTAGRQIEAAFLEEMLRFAGVAEPRESLGGGAGEAQFAPFLRRAYAEDMAQNRGLGIAEMVARSLLARDGAALETPVASPPGSQPR
ncbi:MAG: rod-binding protein [Pseudomonadota bacterium]